MGARLRMSQRTFAQSHAVRPRTIEIVDDSLELHTRHRIHLFPSRSSAHRRNAPRRVRVAQPLQ